MRLEVRLGSKEREHEGRAGAGVGVLLGIMCQGLWKGQLSSGTYKVL